MQDSPEPNLGYPTTFLIHFSAKMIFHYKYAYVNQPVPRPDAEKALMSTDDDVELLHHDVEVTIMFVPCTPGTILTISNLFFLKLGCISR